MKKITFIALAMAIGMASCSEDDCDHKINSGSNSANYSIFGGWYEEAENEEIRYNQNGTFYDRYANFVRCEEIEGRWEYDSKNSKLTYNYAFLGQMQYVDWTVKDLTEFGFTISSSKVSNHNLEKIVESYELKVGETVNIEFPIVYPEYPVISYTTNNERIASVSSDGLIKAEGEKGVTYIKVATADFNVWVAVTVGDNCAEMWHDYVGLMGLDYSAMRKTLSRLGEPQIYEDGYTFSYTHQLHEVVNITEVELCPEDGMVDAAAILIKESVPEAEILSYLNARYYKIGESSPYIYYSTVEDAEESKAIISYNKTDRIVIFNETKHFLHNPHVKDLWTDFVPLFGSDKNQVKKAMNGYGYPYVMSDNNYSKDGSDYYSISGSSYAFMVGFVFNPDKQVSEFWVYMDRTTDANDVYKYLDAKYKQDGSEATEHTFVFYNDDKSMKVTFDLVNAAVIYNKVTMKQHEANNEILGSYYEALGKTHDQIVSQYGAPFSEENGLMFYVVGTDYVDLAAFSMAEETNKCKRVIITINENVATSTIVNYMNSKYTVFANGTPGDGSQYAWTNGSTVAESTMGIIYYPIDKMVIYQPLGSAASAKSRAYTSFNLDYNADLFRQVENETKALFDSAKKTKGNIVAKKSHYLNNILENYNK